MNLEGFEIENWSCIRKLRVSDLPPSGVIVIHGPNRTGKSSAVKALRACLMDYPANSKSSALTKFYPRGSAEKPTVSVVFKAAGATHRIKKQFGTIKSELASKTSTGDWRVETTSAADAHERTCMLVGGDDSDKGLQQLLWLTQAEYRLPESKTFDPGIQAQLRGLLGVLQTPLDDRFLERVRKRWSTWFSGQRKLDKLSDIRKGCSLAENLAKLDSARLGFSDIEGKFAEVEALLRTTADLELRKQDLDQQRAAANHVIEKLEKERERSRDRVAAWERAQEREATAKKEETDALAEQKNRAAAVLRCADAARAVEPAQKEAETIGNQVESLARRIEQLGKALAAQVDEMRNLTKQKEQVAAKREMLDFTERLESARAEVVKAAEVASEIETSEKRFADHPAPDEKTMGRLKANREEAARLRAELDAASMQLSLFPETGAPAGRLTLDDEVPQDLAATAEPLFRNVRRKADLHIAGWGRIEMKRGTGSEDLDQLEKELRERDAEFATSIAPFGISATDSNALESLRERAAEDRLRRPDLENKKKELKRIAPKGLEALQGKVMELQSKRTSLAATAPPGWEAMPADPGELDRLAENLKQRMIDKKDEIKSSEDDIATATRTKEEQQRNETASKEALATATATEKTRREQLELLPTEERTAQRVANARRALMDAEGALNDARLTPEESGIDERLAAARESVGAIDKGIRGIDENYNRIKGRLEGSEGLHSQRSSLAARVDELTRLTDRENLDKDATDRLYELFEECREKQLGTLMGPIHDRVLSWMRTLNIGDYKEVRFSDCFLPEKLVRRDGTAEFELSEESTGAQEQMGILVRLALGSTLASAGEPAIAILDDPLTHADVGRLSTMRRILRRASEGDPTLTPSAGPLQIFVFTCHPEWFRDDRATVIDLEDPVVMSRLAT